MSVSVAIKSIAHICKSSALHHWCNKTLDGETIMLGTELVIVMPLQAAMGADTVSLATRWSCD